MSLYAFIGKVRRGWFKLFLVPTIKRAFGSCGERVTISRGCSFSGIGNIHIGNNVALGPRMTVMCTRARVVIGNDVMFGPNVTMITGSHRIDIPDRPMISITDEEKLPENDQEIIIENDVWIGANVTILKGVTVGTGSVIAAGAVVTKDVEPYSVVGGVPAVLLRRRFTFEKVE